MPVNKNGLPFYLDRKLDVIRFGVDPDNHVKEQQLFNSPVKTEKPNKKERFIEKESESLTQWGTWNIETKMHGRKANNCR